jgi:hypothetical protein
MFKALALRAHETYTISRQNLSKNVNSLPTHLTNPPNIVGSTHNYIYLIFLTGISAFQLLQISWSQVLGDISDQCFSISTPTYASVLRMEHRIRLFELSLPPAFKHGATEGSIRPYIMFQVNLYIWQYHEMLTYPAVAQSQLLALQIYHAKVLLLVSDHLSLASSPLSK